MIVACCGVFLDCRRFSAQSGQRVCPSVSTLVQARQKPSSLRRWRSSAARTRLSSRFCSGVKRGPGGFRGGFARGGGWCFAARLGGFAFSGARVARVIRLWDDEIVVGSTAYCPRARGLRESSDRGNDERLVSPPLAGYARISGLAWAVDFGCAQAAWIGLFCSARLLALVACGVPNGGGWERRGDSVRGTIGRCRCLGLELIGAAAPAGAARASRGRSGRYLKGLSQIGCLFCQARRVLPDRNSGT